MAHIYLGAFALCKLKRGSGVIEKIREIVACNNNKCKQYKKDYKTIQSVTTYQPKFCSYCGQKLSSYDEKYFVPKFYTFDIADAMDNKLYPTSATIKDDEFEINIFIPNTKEFEDLLLYKHFKTKEFVFIIDALIENEIQKFEMAYRDKIDILKTYYDEVEIKYGVIGN